MASVLYLRGTTHHSAVGTQGRQNTAGKRTAGLGSLTGPPPARQPSPTPRHLLNKDVLPLTSTHQSSPASPVDHSFQRSTWMNLKSEARAHVQNCRFLLPAHPESSNLLLREATALGLPVFMGTPKSSKTEEGRCHQAPSPFSKTSMMGNLHISDI